MCSRISFFCFIASRAFHCNRRLPKDGFTEKSEGGWAITRYVPSDEKKRKFECSQPKLLNNTSRWKRNRLPEVNGKNTLLRTQTNCPSPPHTHVPLHCRQLGMSSVFWMTGFCQFYKHYKIQGVKLLQIFVRRHLHSDQEDSRSFDGEKYYLRASYRNRKIRWLGSV